MTTEDETFRQALAPERRYESITLGAPRHGYPGDSALFFKYTNNNGTNIVNLRPGDLPALRAAVIAPDEGLEALQDVWAANLGPGGRRAVEAGHAAGYKLGVDDMLATVRDYEETPVSAAEVREFLLGLQAAVPTGRQRADISAVLELLVTAGDRRDRG